MLQRGTERFIVWFTISLFSLAPLDAKESQPDPSREGRRSLLRSAICPGWGQLTAGSTVKGMLFLAASGALLFGHVRSGRLTSGQRRELNRWTVLFWLYNLGDAYVDGYLHSFDAEMRDLETIGQDLVGETRGLALPGIGVSIRW